jgi:hypothetical protein
MRGNGDGRGHHSGNGHADGGGPVLDLVHLRAEIDRIRSLSRQGFNAAQLDFELSILSKRSGVGVRKLRRWLDEDASGAIPSSLGEVIALVDAVQPELIVEAANLPAAAEAVRDLLAGAGDVFEWGVPAKVVGSSDRKSPEIIPLAVESVVNKVHGLRQPIKRTPSGQRAPITLPDRVARLYLAKKGEWNLPRLAGITTAPLLSDDGDIRAADGYDRETRLWCANVPALDVPARPNEDDARAALQTLRTAFRTFPFADGARVRDPELELELVDLEHDPGLDESAFLVGLLTAVCRPSLPLAPGLMLVAPETSGSGSGKGLLARAICLIAFGLHLAGFTPTNERGELEKRINAELLDGGSAVFIDNVNDAVLASPTLEGAMTERPYKVRTYGLLKNVLLDGAPFVVVTGNGVKPSKDLVRRFAMFAGLDARMENPSLRRFPLPREAFLADIERRRPELLGAALTIWRFGRLSAADLNPGRASGSYPIWEQWCRDPLLALGCQDPVERILELAASDPKRQNELAIFTAWWKFHEDKPVTAEGLHVVVRKLIDPEGGGVLQRIRPWLVSHAGTRLGGFVLEADVDRHPNPKKRRPTSYRLNNLDPEAL